MTHYLRIHAQITLTVRIIRVYLFILLIFKR